MLEFLGSDSGRSTRECMVVKRLGAPLVIVIFLASILGACQASTGFLTDDERDELYAVSATRSSLPIRDGAILPSLSLASFGVQVLDGAEEPVVFELKVYDAAGVPVSSTAYVRKGAKALPGQRTVDSFETAKMNAVMADEPADGFYRFEYEFRNESDKTLQSGSLRVFKVSKGVMDAEIGVYPSSFAVGDAGLLTVRTDAPASLAPYAVWSTGGLPLQGGSGPVSAGFDRIVWPGTSMPGAVTVSLDLYPFPPPAGQSFDFDSPVRKTVKLLVRERGSDAPLLRSGRGFASLFKFEGTPADARAAWADAAFFGKPYLDAYPGGFGYRLGARPAGIEDGWKYSGAGVSVSAARWPTLSGSLLPHTIVVRFLPEANASGVVYAHDFGESRSVTLGVDAGRPYLAFSAKDRIVRFDAGETLPARALTLAVSVVPAKDRLEVFFAYDGVVNAVRQAPFDARSSVWGYSGPAMVAGSDGFPALYDDFGLYCALSNGAADLYPAFAEAAASEYRDDLVWASGFESLSDSAPYSAFARRPGMPGVTLPTDGRFTAAADVRADRPFRVEVAGAPLSVIMKSSGAGTLVVAFDANGGFRATLNGARIGSGALPPGQLPSCSLEPAAASSVLAVGGIRIPVRPALTGTISVSIANEFAGASVVSRALVRYLPDLVGKRLATQAPRPAWR